MMDGVGELKALEACLPWEEDPLENVGENIPGDKDPKDWKVVFTGDNEGGVPLSPGDRGAIAGGAAFIPALCI